MKPDHDILAMSSSTYLALDSKQLPNCRRFSITNYCENLFLVTHRSEHTCEHAIYQNKSACLINEKCNFEYYHELTPEPRVLDASDYLLLAGLPNPCTLFLYKRKTNSKSHRRSSLYYHKENITVFVLNKCRTILPSGEYSFL